MSLPWIFANLPSGNTPASTLDQNFAALGAISTIPCTAAGTNNIVLTPLAGAPSVAAYNQMQGYRFVATATSTAAANLQFQALASLPAYQPSVGGPVATNAGDLVLGQLYDAIYDTALNSGAGGFHIIIVADLSLSANTTFYVRTDGSDANTGTANTAGGAWLTLQHAWDVVSLLNLNGFRATIQIADGTYGSMLAEGMAPGQRESGNILFLGNTGTPANVIITSTSPALGATILAAGGQMTISGMELRCTGGNALQATVGGVISIGASVRFGVVTGGSHIRSDIGSYIAAGASYSIVGAAPIHINATQNGVFNSPSITVTVSGTPAFSTAFAVASGGGQIGAASVTYTGAATGPRYSATLNGVINTGGGGANYFPGNSAGASSTGGQYF